jgi:hypothetical protein
VWLSAFAVVCVVPLEPKDDVPIRVLLHVNGTLASYAGTTVGFVRPLPKSKVVLASGGTAVPFVTSAGGAPLGDGFLPLAMTWPTDRDAVAYQPQYRRLMFEPGQVRRAPNSDTVCAVAFDTDAACDVVGDLCGVATSFPLVCCAVTNVRAGCPVPPCRVAGSSCSRVLEAAAAGRACADLDARCSAWRRAGKCLTDAEFMQEHCAQSCEACGVGPGLAGSRRRAEPPIGRRVGIGSGLVGDRRGFSEQLTESPTVAPVEGCMDGNSFEVSMEFCANKDLWSKWQCFVDARTGRCAIVNASEPAVFRPTYCPRCRHGTAVLYRTVACYDASCTSSATAPIHRPQSVRAMLYVGESTGLADALGYTMLFMMLALLVVSLVLTLVAHVAGVQVCGGGAPVQLVRCIQMADTCTLLCALAPYGPELGASSSVSSRFIDVISFGARLRFANFRIIAPAWMHVDAIRTCHKRSVEPPPIGTGTFGELWLGTVLQCACFSLGMVVLHLLVRLAARAGPLLGEAGRRLAAEYPLRKVVMLCALLQFNGLVLASAQMIGVGWFHNVACGAVGFITLLPALLTWVVVCWLAVIEVPRTHLFVEVSDERVRNALGTADGTPRATVRGMWLPADLPDAKPRGTHANAHEWMYLEYAALLPGKPLELSAVFAVAFAIGALRCVHQLCDGRGAAFHAFRNARRYASPQCASPAGHESSATCEYIVWVPLAAAAASWLYVVTAHGGWHLPRGNAVLACMRFHCISHTTFNIACARTHQAT